MRNGVWNKSYVVDVSERKWKKVWITVEGEATDLGSYKGKSCDLIVASSEIAKQIEADVPVLAITNLLDKAEIEEKIRPYLNK
mgnify:FL=1